MCPRLCLGAAVSACFLALLPTAALAAPPPGDARVAPRDLGRLPALVRSTAVDATLDEDEPGSICGPDQELRLVLVHRADDPRAAGRPRRRGRHGRDRGRVRPRALAADAAELPADRPARRRDDRRRHGGRNDAPRARRPARQLGRRRLHPARRPARRARRPAGSRAAGRRPQRSGGPLRQPRRRLVDADARGPYVPHQPRDGGAGLRAGRALRRRRVRRRRRGDAGLRRPRRLHRPGVGPLHAPRARPARLARPASVPAARRPCRARRHRARHRAARRPPAGGQPERRPSSTRSTSTGSRSRAAATSACGSAPRTTSTSGC